MQRITTTVEPAVYVRLEDLARRDGLPTARLVRDALERYVTERELALEPEPLPEWIGTLGGRGGPYASRDEEELARAWPAALEDGTGR